MEGVCEQNIIHKEVVDRVKISLLHEDKIIDLAEFFKVFGDSTRVKILSALMKEKMCVCDIAATLNMTHSAISHQLRILKQAKLVKYRREGKSIIYSLADDHVKTILHNGIDHVTE